MTKEGEKPTPSDAETPDYDRIHRIGEIQGMLLGTELLARKDWTKAQIKSYEEMTKEVIEVLNRDMRREAADKDAAERVAKERKELLEWANHWGREMEYEESRDSDGIHISNWGLGYKQAMRDLYQKLDASLSKADRAAEGADRTETVSTTPEGQEREK